MEERKYIDRLYQEKFKDFEVAPRENLWKEISAKLQKEKKKPVLLPLWSRIAGVAAALMLIVLLGDWFNPQPKNSIVNNDEGIFSNTPDASKITSVAESKDPIAAEADEKNSQKGEAASPQRQPIASVTSRTPQIEKVPSLGQADIAPTLLKVPAEEPLTEKSNALAEALQDNKTEEQLLAETKPNRLEVSTHAAPVYYGNLKEGSFIDQRFNNSSSQSDVTYSYGINIAYAISDKLKIRSGVSRVSMSTNTHNVALQAVLNPNSLASIDYNERIAIRDINDGNGWKGSSKPVHGVFKSSIQSIARGDLTQELGFIEVPLEVEYVLIDKQVGLNLIGGASTLFLNENTISVSSGDIATELGKANNLNDISFSTNIGLGLDYKISEKFLLNLEPMFKYQLNTFDAATGTYQPFYIAVYSGFSYKF